MPRGSYVGFFARKHNVATQGQPCRRRGRSHIFRRFRPSTPLARVRYAEGSSPVVSSKLQNFFGMLEAPTVAAGAKTCVVELLAPNGRPAALTEDLAGFWKEGYRLVRKDLRGRYPKHDWPESP